MGVWTKIAGSFGIGKPNEPGQQKGTSPTSLSVSDALSLQPRSAAYRRFIDLFIRESTQLSESVRDRIARAREGDSDAFAIIAFMTWQGDQEFEMNKDAAVRGLLKALDDGSGAGAFFIGETFLQWPFVNEAERAKSCRKALPWYGKAEAMGVRVASVRAEELIPFIETNLSVPRAVLMSEYQQGQGVEVSLPNERLDPTSIDRN